MPEKNLRTCPKGHTFYKSSDCPTCPVCEAERKPTQEFLSVVAAPARRALEREGISTLGQLAGHSEAEILALHGIGPNAVRKLREALHAKGLSFREGCPIMSGGR